MKQLRKTFALWTAKVLPATKTPMPALSDAAPTKGLRVLGDEQLRHVAGGTGSTVDAPRGNW
jgi:hypothetical protein